MLHTRQVSPEVLYGDQAVFRLSSADISVLKDKAKQNPRRRIRVCAHRGIGDAVHEMFIVHAYDTYIPPHKHLGKSESFHVIEGTVDVVVFEEDGSVREVINMGDYLSGHLFYYRISDPFYHTLIIRSDVLVFHETTSGPFNRADTIFAPWAPEESNPSGCKAFMRKLLQAADKFLNKEKQRS